MYFLSIVGNQVMAVLNPLLALKSNKLKKIVLFHTHRTKDKADTIIKYLSEDKNYKKITTKKILVSNSLDTEGDNIKPVTYYIEEYNNDWQQKIFNLAGGMNFQIAACIEKLDFDKTRFVYPESSGVHEYRFENNSLIRGDYNLPLPVDVFALQGISFESEQSAEHQFLVQSKKKCLIHNTSKISQNIVINSILFDNVVNIGNELHLLKVIHTSDGKDSTKKVRSVINLALNRDRFADLLHHRIVILTNNPLVEERVLAEGKGKVKVILYTGDMNPGRKYCTKLGDFYKQTGIETQQNQIINRNVVSCDVPVKAGNTTKLYTFIGRNIGPTLAAVVSHRPVELCLLYTPDDPQIVKYKKAIEENVRQFNVKTIEFVPVSFLGEEILDMKLDIAFNNVINITPGTKNHSAFLSLWAKKNSIPVWSVETKLQRIVSLSSNESEQLSTISPIVYLKLIGENVENFGDGKGELQRKAEVFEGILRFLNIIKKGKWNIAKFPSKKIKWEAVEMIINGDQSKIIFSQGNTQTITFNNSKGIWFEQLIGYLAVQCGANDVQTRVRLQWTDQTFHYLENLYNPQHEEEKRPFRSDIDVVARFKGNYFIISCKSGYVEDESIVTQEISAVATIFGRFAVPLFANFKYSGEPKLVNDVYMFGYNTMLNIKTLNKLFTKALEKKQQTRRN